MRSWKALDRAIQRDITRAQNSGNPDEVKRVTQRAAETYNTASGAMAGAALGTAIFPGVGTVVGGVLGAIFGSSATEK